MLRAIGMSRRQVRTMIRYEAVITALIGGDPRHGPGARSSPTLIAQPLKDEGFTLSYPVGSLIVLLVLAALAGVLAAILPARRASRLDVLRVAAVRVGRAFAIATFGLRGLGGWGPARGGYCCPIAPFPLAVSSG